MSRYAGGIGKLNWLWVIGSGPLKIGSRTLDVIFLKNLSALLAVTPQDKK